MPTSISAALSLFSLPFSLSVRAGLFIGAAMAVAHAELGMIKIVCGLAGFVISVPLSYFTFRWVVSEFVVKELAKTTPPIPAAPSAEPPQV